MRVDAHVKVFPAKCRANRETYVSNDPTFRALYGDPKAKLADVEELLESMDRNGIDIACVANIGWTRHEHCVETNDFLLETAAGHPGRLIALCAVNPIAGRPAVEEVRRCAKAGARGIGELHPDTQGFDLGDALVMGPVMEAVQDHGLVLLTHGSEPVGHAYPGKGRVTPEVLYRFATNFPDTTMVMAHWGGGLPFYALMPEVRAALANVHFDTAASPFLYEPGVFEVGAGLVGAEKILFATDFPLIKQETALEAGRGQRADRCREGAGFGRQRGAALRAALGGVRCLAERLALADRFRPTRPTLGMLGMRGVSPLVYPGQGGAAPLTDPPMLDAHTPRYWQSNDKGVALGMTENGRHS